MTMPSFSGTPQALGRAYGAALGEEILKVHGILLPASAYPRDDPVVTAWVGRREALLEQRFPWLLEEMAGVGEGVGLPYPEILWLNLRGWNYFPRAPQLPSGGCSTLALALADGTAALCTALDDPGELYCGPVRLAPAGKPSFVTLPITGTSWAGDSMNSAGLAVGLSSQVFPAEIRLPDPLLPQDLAVRVIMEQCATVGDMRELCREFPFQLNLMAVA